MQKQEKKSRKAIRMILIMLVSTLPMACSTSPAIQQLQHHHYVLQAINHHPLADSAQRMIPDLEFGEGMWLGSTLCGQLSGHAHLQHNRLRVFRLQQIPAPCVDPRWQEAQQRLVAMLQDGARLTLHGPRLSLCDAKGFCLHYTQRDWM